MVGISFMYPKFLLLLLLIPFFVFVYFFSIIYNKKKALIFSNFEAMERVYDIEIFSKNFLAMYIAIAIICLIIFSLSGMNLITNAQTSSFSYVLAIDNSESMKANDMTPTRLDAAKESAKRFIDLLPSGVSVGVLAFSGDARILHELDNSKIKTKMAVDSIDFGGIQGTNIYNAVIAANHLFLDTRGRSVVIISDGQLNVGDAYQITRYANRNNIIINSILIGTLQGGTMDENVTSKADEEVLRSLAFNTDGKFFRASDLEVLDSVITQLSGPTNKEVSTDLSIYLLIAAIVLFTFNWIIHNFRFRTFP